jgi:hypothetical protein
VIFVNIASYRDPECAPTIRDLFRKARHPGRINVAVVLQALPSDHFDLSHPRVKVRHVNANESLGACWARAKGYELWNGESFILQTDSHMRFAPEWDVRLMAQLAACPSPRPLLTTYPPGYEPPDNLLSHKAAFLAARHFDERGVLMQQALMEPEPVTPKPTAFLAAGFLFGPSAWIHDAPYDPSLYFNGEEITLAARLWTHGWDMFGPTEPIVWHQYTRIERSLHWKDNPGWQQLEASSLARMRRLLRMAPRPADPPTELSGYRLGGARSLDEYQRMSGVDFRAMTIAPHALAGEFAMLRAGAPDCFRTSLPNARGTFSPLWQRGKVRLMPSARPHPGQPGSKHRATGS